MYFSVVSPSDHPRAIGPLPQGSAPFGSLGALGPRA